MKLDPFTPDGVLPRQDYPMTLAELRSSFLVTGEDTGVPTWDAPWRAHLVDNLEVLVRQLWRVGVDRIFINGSFVEDKPHPNDIDGYFECEAQRFWSGKLARELNALDPHGVWTWDNARRRPDPNSGKRQLPMWHRYRVELFPHCTGVWSQLRDPFGNELTFPALFRLARNAWRPKGIVQIVR